MENSKGRLWRSFKDLIVAWSKIVALKMEKSKSIQ